MEDLTSLNLQLINRLKRSEQVDKTWSWNGHIYALLKNGRKIQVQRYQPNEFNRIIHNISESIELDVFHLNIRNLNKNHRGLIHLLQSFNLDFDVLVLTEIWSYNLEFYINIFPNHIFYYAEPCGTHVGGVGVNVKKTFCSELHNLEIPPTDTGMVEWLELSKHNSKYIVRGIYRHPNNNINFVTSPAVFRILWSIYLNPTHLVLLLET